MARSHLQGNDWIIALGQLSYLKSLFLRKDSYEGSQLILRDGAFPQLEIFMFHYLPNLAECRIEEGALVCLRYSTIITCPKLKRLPEVLRTITTLQRLLVVEMPPAFCKRLGWEEDDGLDLTIRNDIDKKSTSSKTTLEDGRGSKQRSGEDFHIIQHIPTIEIWISVRRRSLGVELNGMDCTTSMKCLEKVRHCWLMDL